MLLVDRLCHYHFTLYGRSLLTVKRCVRNRRKYCSQIFGVVCRKGIRYVIQKTVTKGDTKTRIDEHVCARITAAILIKADVAYFYHPTYLAPEDSAPSRCF